MEPRCAETAWARGRGEPGHGVNRVAHLWMQDKAGEWTAKPLDDWIELLDYDARDLPCGYRDDRAERTVAIARMENPAGYTLIASWLWVLQAGAQSRVRVNGTQMWDRYQLLHDRDEIQTRNKRFYFAAESPPMLSTYKPDPWSPLEEKPACARCERPIEPFSKAVCCPQCGRWHHESHEVSCWSQGESCAHCSQATALSVGFDWYPEECDPRIQGSGKGGGDAFEF